MRDRKSIQVVEFTLGKEQFAIDLFDVKEAVEYTTIPKLPNARNCIRGIIDLRGDITLIVDLRKSLNITEGSTGALEASRIIVLDDTIAKSKAGILVDDVTSVSTFDGRQVDYTSASVSREKTSIIGIIKRRRKTVNREITTLIIWIDIRQILGDIDFACRE